MWDVVGRCKTLTVDDFRKRLQNYLKLAKRTNTSKIIEIDWENEVVRFDGIAGLFFKYERWLR